MTALCPGPVATEFTEAGGFKSETPGPSFVWSTAEDVAKAGIEGADKGKRVVIPGIGNRVQRMLRPARPAVGGARPDGERLPQDDRRVAQ